MSKTEDGGPLYGFIEERVERIAAIHKLDEDGRKTLRKTLTGEHERRKDGPAFPDSGRSHWGKSGPCDNRTWPGLSKRELCALVLLGGKSNGGVFNPEDVRSAFDRAEQFLDISAWLEARKA